MEQQVSPSPEQLEQEIQNAYADALNRYGQLIGLAYTKMKPLSARNIQRAVIAALNFGVNDDKVKFEKATEAELGAIIAKLLDEREIILAYKLREKEKVNEQAK